MTIDSPSHGGPFSLADEEVAVDFFHHHSIITQRQTAFLCTFDSSSWWVALLSCKGRWGLALLNPPVFGTKPQLVFVSPSPRVSRASDRQHGAERSAPRSSLRLDCGKRQRSDRAGDASDRHHLLFSACAHSLLGPSRPCWLLYGGN